MTAPIKSGKLNLANPGDRDWTRHRYVLCFGAYGWTLVVVWANSLEGALDGAIDWIVDFAPGLLCDDEVAEAYQEAIASGMTEEAAWEEAEQDTTCGGNCGNRILSYQWGIVAEDPDRETLIAIRDR